LRLRDIRNYEPIFQSGIRKGDGRCCEEVSLTSTSSATGHEVEGYEFFESKRHGYPRPILCFWPTNKSIRIGSVSRTSVEEFAADRCSGDLFQQPVRSGARYRSIDRIDG